MSISPFEKKFIIGLEEHSYTELFEEMFVCVCMEKACMNTVPRLLVLNYSYIKAEGQTCVSPNIWPLLI